VALSDRLPDLSCEQAGVELSPAFCRIGMVHPELHVVYEFAGYRLDPRRHQLLRADGKLVPLTPRVFDTLVCLVEHRGDLLDKATLLTAVWPNVVVEENSLSQSIPRCGRRWAIPVVITGSSSRYPVAATDSWRT